MGVLIGNFEKKNPKGTGQNYYTQRGPTFGAGRGVLKDTLSSNITNNILLAFKFELTQEYSASKSRHY